MQPDLIMVGFFIAIVVAFIFGLMVGRGGRDLSAVPIESLMREIIARKARTRITEMTQDHLNVAVLNAVKSLAGETWTPTTPPPNSQKTSTRDWGRDWTRSMGDRMMG